MFLSIFIDQWRHAVRLVVALAVLALNTPSALALPATTVGDTVCDSRSAFAMQLGVKSATDHVRGLQLSLLTNLARKSAHGVQLALLGNSALGESKGVQIASLFNYASEARGVQVATLTNIATKGARGLQLSGVSNVAVEASHGIVQIGLSNATIGALRGAQVGAINFAGSLHGVQLGLLNMAGGQRLRGVQIGLINTSQDTSALKIGLVNVTPSTRVQLLVWGGNTTKANVGVRFMNGRLYTQFSIGFVYRGLDDRFSGTIGYRAGYCLPLGAHWKLLGDLGVAHIENANEAESYKVRRMYALQARISASWQCWKRVGIFATGGYSHARFYSRGSAFEHKPLAELGLIFR